MRMIDANALIEGYKQMGYDSTEHPEESYMEGWCKGFNAAVDHCMHHVTHAPTIEERKKGKWIQDNNGYYVCDHCGEPCADEIMGKPRDRYCKWCGADMRGDEHEDR